MNLHHQQPALCKATLLIYLTASLLLQTVMAQSQSGGETTTVGPEAQCDYPDLQEGFDNLYTNCGNNCLAGIPNLHLSENYQHSGDEIILDRSIDIHGGFAGCTTTFGSQATTVRAQNSRLFTVDAPSSEDIIVTLTNLKVQGGGLAGSVSAGGVIQVNPGTVLLYLDNTEVVGGNAGHGGGIAISGAGNTLQLVDSEVSSNVATDGGGIYCENGGHIEFTSGRVFLNQARNSGAGIHLDNCSLTGTSTNQSRIVGNTNPISGNIVLRNAADDAPGFGAGIFATGPGSLIQLGGLLSDTVIAGNEVRKWQPDTIQTNTATGGGLHLRGGARAELINVRFERNSAPHGGAISMQSGASLFMDRSSGLCVRPEECSAFVSNEATGTILSGNGSALYLRTDEVDVKVRRTVFRQNSSYNHNGDDAAGSTIDILGGSDNTVELSGNLMIVNNHTGGLNNLISLIDNINLPGSGPVLNLFQNTIAFNETESDLNAVIEINNGVLNTVGNLIYEPDMDEGVLADFGDPAFYSACNVTGPDGDLFTSIQNGGANVTTDNPGFVNSGIANFRIMMTSPAHNRCDDQEGLIDLSFDILGRERPKVFGNTQGLGFVDSGAYEFHPNLATEVDLVASLRQSDEPSPLGIAYTAWARNIGLTPLNASRVMIRFPLPAAAYTTQGAICTEVVIDNQDIVECRYSSTVPVPVLGRTSDITIQVSPDNLSQCQLSITASTQNNVPTDTVLSNNSAELDPVSCTFIDEVFSDGFE